MAACAGSGLPISDQAKPEETTVPDPTSTGDLEGLGGASFLPLDWGEIADLATLAVEAQVADVRPSRLNTEDGSFPSAEELAEAATAGHPLDELLVLTDIELVVRKTLGHDGSVDPPEQDDPFVISVFGGAFRTVLDTEQAQLLGVLQVDQAPDDDGDPSTPAPEVEEPAEGPVPVTWGFSSSESFTEDEVVVVFLREQDYRDYRSGTINVVWTPVHPYAVFDLVDGRWVSQYAEATAAVDAIALAEEVGSTP